MRVCRKNEEFKKGFNENRSCIEIELFDMGKMFASV